MFQVWKEIWQSSPVEHIPAEVQYWLQKVQEAQRSVQIRRNEVARLKATQGNLSEAERFEGETASDFLKVEEESCLRYYQELQRQITSLHLFDPHSKAVRTRQVLNYTLKKSLACTLLAAIVCFTGLMVYNSYKPLPPFYSSWFWYLGSSTMFASFSFLWVKGSYNKAKAEAERAFNNFEQQYNEVRGKMTL